MNGKNTLENLDISLSISDRIGGYSLGDFQKAMEMAKMNAHSSGWHPAFIVRRSVVSLKIC